MRRAVSSLICGIVCCWLQQASVVASAQEQRPRVAVETSGPAPTPPTGAADGAWSPALTGARRPLYRVGKSDVIELAFTFSPEFNQTVSVRPDGFITLKGSGDLLVDGLTVPELHEAVRAAYAGKLHDPEVTVALKDFDKPYFIASGQVARPGKYELRAETTITEAVAIAGGFNEQAKHSQVVLFRRVSDEWSETRLLNLKRMFSSHNLREDVYLRPGDMLYVPQNTISKIRRYLPASNLSLYSNPSQF